jgi:ankyrin repeat protein
MMSAKLIAATSSLTDLTSVYAGLPEHMAVVYNNIEFFSRDDVDVNAPHHFGHTPLTLAIVLRRSRIIKLLIDRGANINAKIRLIEDEFADHYHRVFVAHIAAKCGDLETVQLLIDANMRLDVHDSYHNNVLHFAAENPDSAVVRLLLKTVGSSLPLDATNGAGMCLMQMAALNENDDVTAALLAAGCPVRDGALLVAATNNSNVNVVSILISNGADVNAPSRLGNVPILGGVQNRNEAVLAQLIAAGADVNARDAGCSSVLTHACSNTNEKVLDMVIAAGAMFADKHERFSACLHAAVNPNPAIMARLIQFGCDVKHTCESSGTTALLRAAEFGTVEVVRMLLDAGADIHARCVFKHNACHRAARNSNAGVMRALIAAGCDFRACSRVFGPEQTPFLFAIECDNLDAIRALEEAGIDVIEQVIADWSQARRWLVNSQTGSVLRFFIRRGLKFPTSPPPTRSGWLESARAWLSGSPRAPLSWQHATAPALAELFAVGVELSVAVQVLRENRLPWTDSLLTVIAAGADVRNLQRPTFSGDVNTALLVAAEEMAPVAGVPQRLVQWACGCIALRQFALLRLRGFEVCVGLQSLCLSALVLCEILEHVFMPRTCVIPFHRLWALATTIKHFRE